MEKGLFLYNPKSGDQSIKNKLDYIFERFQNANVILVPFRLFQNEHCTDSIVEILRRESFSFILLFGGDGSLNYIVNLLLKNGLALPLGVYPCGTCNDFAHNLGMLNDFEHWFDMILSGNTKYVDIGCINDHHYFLGNLGGGVFANVSFNTDNELKKKLGPVAYYLKALDELPNIEAFSITVDTENRKICEQVILFLVLNGRNVAGFANFFSGADFQDGLFDILLFKKARPLELAGLLMKILANELPGDKRIIHLRAKEVRIQSDKNIQITVDGERGSLLPIKVQCIHPGIRFIAAN